MAADRQGTTDGDRAEPTNKLYQFGEEVLVGCSGLSNYIQDFEDHLDPLLDESREENPKALLRKAIKAYSKDVISEAREMGVDFQGYPMPRASIIRGIMASYDDEKNWFSMFDFITPHPAEDVSLVGHAAVGSGSDSASTLFSLADFLLGSIYRSVGKNSRELDRTDLSPTTVERFAYLVIPLIAEQDIYTGLGLDVRVLDRDGITGYGPVGQSHIVIDEIADLANSFWNDLKPAERYGLRLLFDLKFQKRVLRKEGVESGAVSTVTRG